jgi:hypothetical protein
MARGWESKSVEEQQQLAVTPSSSSKAVLTPEQVAMAKAREELELARKRVCHQLEAVQNVRHREMLERALLDLDERLAKLQ